MSKDITYPFDDQLHIEGLFAGFELPHAAFMKNALSTGFSNMVPQKVDREGRLHYAVFNALHPSVCTDIVFKVEGCREEDALARKQIQEFTEKLQTIMDDYQHMVIRDLSNDKVSYHVLRIFFTRDFKCTHHPEMRLGEPSKPYLCPVCGSMQISGLPHIEDTSE